MRLKQLEENVRYGQKEKDVVLKNLNDFKFGFEIEMNPGNGSIDEDTTFEEYLSERDEDVTITSSESGDLAEILVDYILDDTYEDLYNDSEKLKIFNDDVISMFNFGDSLTGDMFPFELHYTIISTLIEQFLENEHDDIYEIVNTLNNYESDIDKTKWKYLILAIMNDSDVDIAVIKESDLDELVVNFMQYTDRLKNIMMELENSEFIEGDGSLISMNDMDTDMRNDFNRFYNSTLKVHIDALTVASTNIKNNPSYSENLRFENLHSDDIAKIIETEIDDLFGNHGLALAVILKNFDLESYHSEILDELMSNNALFNTDEYERYREALEGGDHDGVFYDLSNTDNVHYTTEADGQIEIITTKPVSGKEILEHYEQMKDIIRQLEDVGYYAGSNSGLHLSISYKNGDTGINFEKFIVLSDMYKISEEDYHSIRNYVNDVFKFVKDSELDILEIIIDNVQSSTNPINDIVNKINDGLSKVRTTGMPKYHGINFEDYYRNGRVELRFFGGDNYDDRLDEYLDKLIKFMYILKISSDDTHDTNYYKALVKITNKVFSKRFGMTIDEATRNVKVNMNLMKNRLGLKEYTFIDELHGEIEGITLKSKNSKVRAVLGDLLEYIEDRNYYQMMIDPDVTQALKIFVQHRNSK